MKQKKVSDKQIPLLCHLRFVTGRGASASSGASSGMCETWENAEVGLVGRLMPGTVVGLLEELGRGSAGGLELADPDEDDEEDDDDDELDRL